MPELRIYSPIKVYEELPYEPPWTDTGEDFRELSPAEANQCRTAIADAMRRCLKPEEWLQGLKTGVSAVRTAFPNVEIVNGKLTAVLICRCKRELSPYELDELSDWWEHECMNGFGRRLKHTRIRAKGIGEIEVRLWADYSDWNVTFAEEMEAIK